MMLHRSPLLQPFPGVLLGLCVLSGAFSVSAGAASSSVVQAKQVAKEAYILGPGDELQIELVNIPELSGIFPIGPDGTLYLPRLRSLYVEGLTVDELRYFLTEQYKEYVKDPQIYIQPVAYRAVRVYVGGEIRRPGYYTISGGKNNLLDNQDQAKLTQGNNSENKPDRWPTLFDALRAAEGITPFSNLSMVQVTRKQALSAGGGKIRANLDFMQLVTEGEERVNIRLFDGDSITVARSPKVLRDQLLAASRTNLSPDFIEVFVSGRVHRPGPQELPQGSTLNQAIAGAGGPKLLRGSVEFLRFNSDGTTDRRRFSYNESARNDEFKNPVLMTGDVVRVNDSLFSAGVEVLNEITGPAVGIYSVYSLFKP